MNRREQRALREFELVRDVATRPATFLNGDFAAMTFGPDWAAVIKQSKGRIAQLSYARTSSCPGRMWQCVRPAAASHTSAREDSGRHPHYDCQNPRTDSKKPGSV